MKRAMARWAAVAAVAGVVSGAGNAAAEGNTDRDARMAYQANQ